jgi:hypothetical protein
MTPPAPTLPPPPDAPPPVPLGPTTIAQAALGEALRSTPTLGLGLYLLWSALQARLDGIDAKIDGGADGGLAAQIQRVDERVTDLAADVQAIRVDVVRLQERQPPPAPR